MYTLPTLLALDSATGDELRPLLTDSISSEERDRAAALVRGSGAIEESVDLARTHALSARKALEPLPESPGVTGLTAAAEYLVESVEAAAAAKA